MITVRNTAILLGLLGAADLLFLPTMMNNDGSEPTAPMAVVILTVVLGLGSIAAAVGLLKAASWARPTGLVTRILDALSTIPALFVGLPTAELVGAVVVALLSLLCAFMLFKLAPAKGGTATA